MRVRYLLASLFALVIYSYSHAQDRNSAEDYRLEALYALKLVELMEEHRGSQSSSLTNYIECSIDSSLWESHATLRDKNRSDKYTPDELAGFRDAHMQLLNALRNYRSKYPEAKCVK